MPAISEKLTFKGLRRASKPERKLIVSFDRIRYDFVHRTARLAGVTPSQVLVAALIHIMPKDYGEWLPNPATVAQHLKSEGKSLGEIVRLLNLQKFRTRRRTLWRSDTVLRLLQRTRLTNPSAKRAGSVERATPGS